MDDDTTPATVTHEPNDAGDPPDDPKADDVDDEVVDVEEAEPHPEPVPAGFITQDNVSDPTRQVTRNEMTGDESHHTHDDAGITPPPADEDDDAEGDPDNE